MRIDPQLLNNNRTTEVALDCLVEHLRSHSFARHLTKDELEQLSGLDLLEIDNELKQALRDVLEGHEFKVPGEATDAVSKDATVVFAAPRPTGWASLK